MSFHPEELTDPWRTERARHGSASLMRVIDPAAGTQIFKIIPEPRRNAKHQDLELHRILDGLTIIQTDQDLKPEERLAIIRHFDELWREANASAEPARA